MKKNVIAVMLSLVLAIGSVGAPVFAAEDTTAQGAVEDSVEGMTEEESTPEEEEEVSNEGTSESDDEEEDSEEGATESEKEDDADSVEETEATSEKDEDEPVAEEEVDADLIQEEAAKSAQAGDIIDSGRCGADGDKFVTWTLTGTNTDMTLTISGSVEMDDYEKCEDDYDTSECTPWESYKVNIKTVCVENGVTAIGNYAFSGCSNLTDVTISDSVTRIGHNAFSGCSSLPNVMIPDSVTSIWDSVFEDCSSLMSVTIPDSVTSIGASAFENCISLTSVTIGNGVSEIGISAFGNCSNLTGVTIGNSVRDIMQGAFGNCSNLTSVTIPNSVKYIGNYVFYGCSSLISVTIGDSVTSIGDFAFSGCSGLQNIMIPDSVTNIGERAFYECSNLTSVAIGSGVTSFGLNTFEGCSSLTSVTIGNGVTSIGERTFYECSNLTSVTIPDSVTSIGNSAFSGCSGLTSVTIGNSVTSIGDSAFSECRSLTSVTIGSSVTSIGVGAFYGCISLTDVTIPDSVTSIGGSAFRLCENLTSMTIPDSVESIGGYAFENCSNLTSVTIGNGVTSIGSSAFSDCSSLTSVMIGNGVTSIGSYAFSDCSNLTSVTIPDSVTSIGSSAFSGCSNLKSVTIPDSVTSILERTFSGCSNLKRVTIGNSVPIIGDYAFSRCGSLTSVKIPDSVTSIRNYAFWNCDSLSDIYYAGSQEEWGQIKRIGDACIPNKATIHFNWAGEIPADGVQYITATLGEETYPFNGKPVEPTPTVTLTMTTEDGTETRELSQDEYSITYENNDKPGKATLTVSGTGEYSGLSDTVEYTINSVVGVRYITAVLDKKTYKYEGKPIEPKPTVYYYETTEEGEEEKELTESEYTITYKDNDKPGKATLTVTTVGDYSGFSVSVFFTITGGENLKITQPSGGKNYAFAGDVQKKKTFTMTLDQAEEEPKKSDFKFEIKKSGNLNTTPSNEVSDPSVEVLNIKKTADRKYTITFDYAPDETGFYGLTVSYKDNVDDAELMVYDSNILEKLEADLDGTVNKYYKSYSKRVSKEIEKLMKETEAEPDYVQLAQKLMQDSSNVLAGTQIGDSHVDKDSVNLCVFEAYARFIYQTGGRSGVHFDEVDNKSAAIKIVNTINGYIIDNGGVTESDVPLNSKVIIDGKEYSAKASWNIWSFGAGQIFVKVVDKNGNVKSYENSITSLVEARAATANYCEALKDLEISSMKNIANCWYTELVDVLGWDILKDVDSKRQEMIKVVSDDITQGLEKRGIKNILDNIKSCHTYYKQARGFIEKLEKLDNVFKNPKSTSEMILSVYRIKNMDTLSLEPGDCSEDIYNLVKNGEEKWREYMYEYFTTGTVKELEPDTVLNWDVLKNGVKNIFNCPINITVYDPSGNISGYIGDDDLWFNDDIFIKEEGDTKIIYTPKTGGYHFGVTGTGHGTVTYTAEELSDGEANGSRLNYYDLPVEIGTEINIGLNSGSLSSGADISVNTPDSSYEPETVDHSSAITVTVDNDPEKGTVTGAGPYVAGDVVTLTATPNEEYHFVGWYENDQLKSHKKSYWFVARKDITLTARYIERKEDENILDSGTCGENVTWSLDEEGTLTISGAGEMANYRGRQEIDLEVTYSSNSPWFDYGIKTVIIEDGVTSIGRAAFCGCGKLERVEIPDSVTTIGEWAFSGCESLDCIEIPEGVTSIGEKLFAYCINLRSVTIPVGVRSIGNSAFMSCKKLTDIEIPPNVTTIGAWAFIGCNSLTDIIIPEGIKTISGSLFEDCFNLVSVTIPNSVTSIKEDAFNKCNGLTDIYYGGSRKSWDAISIGNNNTALTDATLHLSLANAEVSGLTNKTYTGKAITQNPVVTLCGETLLEGTDYRVSYANNTNAGTATVNIIGVVNYEGTVTSTFNINKAANKITASNRTLSYSTKARSLSLNVKATAGKISYKSNNTKVKVTSAGKVTIPAKFSGTAKITITAAGSSNYNKGTKTITITVPAKITLSSVSSPSARKMRVVWKKNTSVTGYQIQYSLKSSFASPKTVTIGKNTQYAKTFSGLTRGKKYYVRIRSYKTVSGKKYYSAWSATKATTIKK